MCLIDYEWGERSADGLVRAIKAGCGTRTKPSALHFAKDLGSHEFRASSPSLTNVNAHERPNTQSAAGRIGNTSPQAEHSTSFYDWAGPCRGGETQKLRLSQVASLWRGQRALESLVQGQSWLRSQRVENRSRRREEADGSNRV